MKLFTTLLLLPTACLHAALPTDTLPSNLTMNEITISANRQPEVKMRIPQPVYTLGAGRMARTNAQTTADLLVADGMLTVQKSQQGGGSPVIRGFESSRVLLVVDNVRMNNLIYRAGHLQNVITIDPSILERAEILYGPASVNYGSDALGGVVAFQTKSPLLSDTDKLSFKGNSYLRYGSVNDETTGHIDFNIGGRKFASLTSLTYSRFGDLRSGREKNPFLKDDEYIHRQYEIARSADGKDLLIPNGQTYHQPQSGYMQYDLLQKLLYRPSDRTNHLLNFQFSNTGDIPRYDRLTDMKGDKPKFAEWYYGPQFRLMTAYTLTTTGVMGADRAGLTIAYQKVKESRHNRKLNDAWLGSRNESVDIVSLSSDWMKLIGNHHLHAGIDGALQFLSSTAYCTDIDTGERGSLDTRYPDGNNRMHNIDLFFSHRWEINPQLTFSAGVRVGYSALRSEFISAEFFPFLSRQVGKVRQDNPTYSLSAGITYNPTHRWKVAFSVSTGYRVPNIDDVGKVFDSQPGLVVVPNPNVRPEKTVNADLNVAHLQTDRLIWELSLFGTYLFDAITLTPYHLDGQPQIEYDGELSDVYANHNSRRAFVTGASTRIKARIHQNLTADAALTYTYGDIIENSAEKRMPLDHVAPLFGRAGLSYESNDKRTFVELYSLFNGRKALKRYNLNGEDNIGYATVKGEAGKGLPAWFTLNLKASYRPHPNLTLQAGIENLLDTEYRTFASGINAPGRNIFAAIRAEF